MAGGIQKGTVATDAKARKLDKQCKYLQKVVYEKLKTLYPELTKKRKLDKSEIPGGKGACEPDGALWFYKDTLIAAFEAKKQQDKGNVIERWFKNNYICRLISPEISYVTFCTGEGAYDLYDEESGELSYGTIVHALSVAHLNGFDKYNAGQNSAFLNIDGFSDEFIEDVMIKTIIERIDNVNNLV
jgi:hypothetical protein